MTAPRPDLDALEARLLDAERADLLVEHGVRHADIKWIFAAARERDALNAHLTEVSDTYRASAEAFQRALAAERQRAEQAEQREARLRAALVAAEDIMSRHTSDLDFRQMMGFAPEVMQARAALAEAEARCPCCADTGRCTYPDGTAHPCPTCGTDQPREDEP